MENPQTFNDLMKLSEPDLSRLNMGLVNLISAKGLPGSDDLDVDACLAKLGLWAEEIRQETERNLQRFQPRKPRDTVGFVKCWTLVKTIRHRKGLRHHLEPENADPKSAWIARGNSTPGPGSSFRSAEPKFIGGLLGPNRIGSCTSFPALYTAIGQLLGYPIKLILVVAHNFIRWDDPADRFNMDGGPNYINIHPDDYYIDKPVPWTKAERTCGNWFRPLSPREELGHWAGLRGCVFEANFRSEEAWQMYMTACRLLPKCPLYPLLLNRVAETMSIGRRRNPVLARGATRLHAAHPIATPPHPTPSWGARLVTPTRFATSPFSTCSVIQNPDQQ